MVAITHIEMVPMQATDRTSISVGWSGRCNCDLEVKKGSKCFLKSGTVQEVLMHCLSISAFSSSVVHFRAAVELLTHPFFKVASSDRHTNNCRTNVLLIPILFNTSVIEESLQNVMPVHSDIHVCFRNEGGSESVREGPSEMNFVR